MFKNLHELIATMPDEKTCRDYLIKERWNGVITCPYCGNEGAYVIESGKRFKCRSSACYKKFSVTVGTIFEASNIKLNKWFMAGYLALSHKKGISSYQLAKDIGVSQKTAWFMLHRIRQVMYPQDEVKSQGIIEVDEVYIGGRMKNKHKKIREQYKEQSGHAGNKTGVMGVMERGKDVKAKVIDSKVATLKEMVKQNVATNAIVITDALNAYNGLDVFFEKHEVIYHDKNSFVEGYVHTNTVEGFFSYLKRSIFGIYHQVSPKHLQSYCNENAYRYNTRKMTDPERFNVSLQNIERRLDYKTLTADKEISSNLAVWQKQAKLSTKQRDNLLKKNPPNSI